MINSEDIPNRRSKGSCAWSGIMNTFFWFDQEKDIGGTIMMQIAPCYHENAKQVLKDLKNLSIQKQIFKELISNKRVG